ncbi:nudix hydrolase 20, chloroplastic-like isoform X4 [Primulina huaijiensis]|uniref:nudix hydrolase 20, chloroplastic-like isoform X4 n=1 Tax=Primulina huaijiensis TaxID=1492673 RepID=UPI003CC79985
MMRFQEKLREFFVPFVVEEQIVGYVHKKFAHHLRRFEDTFTFPENTSYGLHFGYHIALHTKLSTYKDRTIAVGDVIKCLGEELIPGIRNEVSADEWLRRKRWEEISLASEEKYS